MVSFIVWLGGEVPWNPSIALGAIHVEGNEHAEPDGKEGKQKSQCNREKPGCPSPTQKRDESSKDNEQWQIEQKEIRRSERSVRKGASAINEKKVNCVTGYDRR